VRNSSLDHLVAEHLPAALRFATRLCGDPARAEEIVQEALVRVVRSWRSFRGASEFRTWLFRIVINVFRDRQRRGADMLPIHDCRDELADAAPQPAAAAMVAELGELVAREVSRLPARQREVLVLVAYEGLSTHEVAEALGISEANVHSTLWAARSRLKARLAPYFKSVEN
jgi:RNA polymerase sigma-70 factor (ECF subfamily)